MYLGATECQPQEAQRRLKIPTLARPSNPTAGEKFEFDFGLFESWNIDVPFAGNRVTCPLRG